MVNLAGRHSGCPGELSASDSGTLESPRILRIERGESRTSYRANNRVEWSSRTPLFDIDFQDDIRKTAAHREVTGWAEKGTRDIRASLRPVCPNGSYKSRRDITRGDGP